MKITIRYHENCRYCKSSNTVLTKNHDSHGYNEFLCKDCGGRFST